MATFFLAIRTFLKGVPWQIWAGIGLIAAAFIYGEVRYNAGKQVILERLEQAEIEAEQKAIKARAIAAEGHEERAREFEHEQETIRDAINEAEEAGRNPLDELFSVSF